MVVVELDEADDEPFEIPRGSVACFIGGEDELDGAAPLISERAPLLPDDERGIGFNANFEPDAGRGIAGEVVGCVCCASPLSGFNEKSSEALVTS